MVNAKKAFRVIEDELNTMTQEERVAYLRDLGFVLKPKNKASIKGTKHTSAITIKLKRSACPKAPVIVVQDNTNKKLIVKKR